MNTELTNAEALAAPRDLPLCVDLDGSLVSTGTSAEAVLGMLSQNIWTLLKLPGWLLQGKSAFRASVARQFVTEAELLPYNHALLGEITEQHKSGREIVLVTAAHESIANAVAAHLKIFSRVIASTDNTHLTPALQAEKLVAEFGERGFDYVAGSREAIPVWSHARTAYLASPDPQIEAFSAQRGVPVERSLGLIERPSLRDWARVLRLHQWLKNGLVFVPLITSLSLLEPLRLFNAVMAFLLFGLTASAVYITNDLLDLPADRRHTRKRWRPFASGRVPPASGLMSAPLLLLLSFVLSIALLPPMFTLSLLLYLVITFAYSFRLKKLVLIDVIVLASLYTLRMIAGAFAVNIEPSFWLLAFSMFVFLSLALIKRYTELQDANEAGKVWIDGRGYRSTDLRLLMSLGTSSGYVAVLVLALYVHSPEVAILYETPRFLWLLCPLLLYWIARMWMHAERSYMHDDPVVYAAKDKVTHAIIVLGAIVILLASTRL